MHRFPPALAVVFAATLPLPVHAQAAGGTAATSATPATHVGHWGGHGAATTSPRPVTLELIVQADAYRYEADALQVDGNPVDGSRHDRALRRAEVWLRGKGPGDSDWVVGYDAKARRWRDANLRWRVGATQSVQLGQFKQPFGMEELGSSRSDDFIARSMPTSTFALSRRLGLGWGMARGNATLAASVFGNELTGHANAGPGFALRAAYAPVNRPGALLHLGVAHTRYAARVATGSGLIDAQRWRARPDADLAARLVDTGILPGARAVGGTGAEVLWVHGPVKLQAEYLRSTTQRGAGLRDFSGDGAYASAMWNVTGESWGYKGGVPTMAAPRRPGAGLWQLGVRWDRIDLDDGRVDRSGAMPVVVGVLGGRMQALTLGTNLYLGSHLKLALNIVRANSRRYAPAQDRQVRVDPSIIEMRGQLVW